MFGLKRNKVVLCEHNPEWERRAVGIIKILKDAFGNRAIDIQHTGSTAIRTIKAKPMLDITVGVDSFDGLDEIFIRLEKAGIYKSPAQPIASTILCAVKSSRESDVCLAVPHIVVFGSPQWNDQIHFRDFLNSYPEKAKKYEKLKVSLAEQFPDDRNAYSNGKREFIEKSLSEWRKNIHFTCRAAITADLEAIWDKDIAENTGDGKYIKWKSEYIGYNRDGMARTFVVLRGREPVGQGTLLFSPACKAVAGRTVLADGKTTANINALRIDKAFENQGHISRLIKLMEKYATDNGYIKLTIGVEEKELRNRAIYEHWGYTEPVLSQGEGDGKVLYFAKELLP